MRCLLCGVLLNECDELEDINKKSPFSKKSFLSIVKYLAKTAKPPILVTCNKQLNESYICKTCCYDVLIYDEYMVKLLEVQKRIISFLRNPMLSEDLITIQTLGERIDGSNVKIEEFEIDVQSTTEQSFTGGGNYDKNNFIEGNENIECIVDDEKDGDEMRSLDDEKDVDEMRSLDVLVPPTNVRGYNIPVKCDICCKVFKNRTHLSRHVSVTHKSSKQVWKCEICGITAKDEEYLELHRNIHEGRSDLECRYCNKRYSRKINVIRHMHKHWDKKNVQCERCGLRFSELPVYYNHKLQHDAEDDPLICAVCNQSFKTRRTYRNHLWTHRDDRPRYSCEICGKTFVEKYTLKVHLRCHSNKEGEYNARKIKNKTPMYQGEKKFDCVICGDQFFSKDLYNQHMEEQHDVILKADVI